MKTPPPPKGFIYAGHGPLAHPSETETRDILWQNYKGEWIDDHNGWIGCTDGPWAVREGSPVAIANGLPRAEPDPALAAFNALAEQINAKLDAINARLDRIEARASDMDDITMLELPWNPKWPEPPPLPEGKTRWVNRGTDWPRFRMPTTNRSVYWLKKFPLEWRRAEDFSHVGVYHIEAV